MATIKEKELKHEVGIALREIGEIKPWFDEEVNAWVFQHPFYPVEYAGDSQEDVIKNYPLYLEVFIEHRMQERIDDILENKTKGKGGYRPGSGRPKGTTKGEKSRIYVPVDIATWLKNGSNLEKIRHLIAQDSAQAVKKLESR